MLRLLRLTVLVPALCIAYAAQAAAVRVAVAANFAGPLARIAEDFTAATGHRVLVSSGATGKFYAQIAAGAPFDVLLAGDAATPGRLLEEGHAVAGSRFTYATGRLALWSANPRLVDERGAVLRSGRFAHLSMANPKTAPYGAAAMQVLQALELGPTLAPRLVTGENVAQAFQFVVTGNAELGFVAWSQVKAPGRPLTGSTWLVPATLHEPIRQDAVLLKAGAGNPAAAALLAYLMSAPARTLIRAFGYEA